VILPDEVISAKVPCLQQMIEAHTRTGGMADVLDALDLLAAPSRWEGFGLVLAEAMASGLPVIASKVGSMPAVAGHAARLVPPDDAGALAGAIAALLGDPVTPAAMRAAGLIQANLFDWSQSATKVEALYHLLVAGR
jgi:glycosyltransferase involved in cell wall biosynthesis